MPKNINKLAESLTENEVLILKNLKGKVSSETLGRNLNLAQVEVIRALQWLDNKELIELDKNEKEIIDRAKLGKLYFNKGFPERKLINQLTKTSIKLDQAISKVGISKEELSVSLGTLKKKGIISLDKGEISLKIDKKKALDKSLEEKFFEILPIEISALTPENKYAFEELRKRKEIIEVKKKSTYIIEINKVGKDVLKNLPKSKLIDNLTSDLIKEKSWENKKFRRYDVDVRVPEIFGGKRQAYYKFLADVRDELVRLGFKQMNGPTVESEFWNFDALFQPQFHIARDWTATYYTNSVTSKLPNKEIVNNVKKQHQKSWEYDWKEQKAKKSILRPQGTCMSARMLANKPNIPGKYFAIARCYRPDVIDATHLAEFNQVEGIILDKDINFKHLLGILKQFAEVFTGSNEVRFVPDYYPFTEPSVELNVKHPKLGWIEIGGAGIFREEVTKPLGINEPVIAWGLGVDRLAMFKLDIKDIRNLFSQDLDWLRKT